MAIVIDSDFWEPNHAVYIFIFVSCFVSVFCLPHFTSSNRTPIVFDLASPPSFLRFQRTFLLIYALSSVLEGLWSAFGEFELVYYGVSREHMVLSLSIGFAAALFLGSFLGVLSDLIGQKKVCASFCALHLFVGILKRIAPHPSIWLASICLSLTNSIFLFSFETWIVVEHDKLGQRQDALNDMFWLMTFTESVSLICSQMLANWLVGVNVVSPSTAAVLLSIICIIFITWDWRKSPPTVAFNEYRRSFYAYVFGDKRIWLLAWAQTCVHFSIAVFWILWAPSIVADGREVHLGLIYPCLLGARVLGSTAYPWFVSGPLSIRTEDCLIYVFTLSGIIMSIVAYDYQEIGVLVTLFCLFNSCIGLILPSLARLRTLYVPNELRGGMISLSLAPANAAVLLFLMHGGLYRNLNNSTIIAFAAIGLLSASGCMHLLKNLGKQPGHNWHKS